MKALVPSDRPVLEPASPASLWAELQCWAPSRIDAICALAEVTKLDMKIEGGKVVAYRAKVSLSFKYEA